MTAVTSAGDLTYQHVVVKGDTLWDICEEYYGDPDLWPKLWEMNPFVTNPHLLEPGDIITLLEGVPLKKLPTGKASKGSLSPSKEAGDGGLTGIDVSVLTDVESIGFLSTVDIQPLGHILADETERVILSEGDTIYLSVKESGHLKSGTPLRVFQKSPLLKHPTTGKQIGYSISFLGKLIVEEKVKENIYKAKLVKGYKAVRIGDSVMPFEAISNCVLPMPCQKGLETTIAAIKDERHIVGQFSVVYLTEGYHHGIRRGNVLKIVLKKEAATPEKTPLPDVVLGNALILEARPDTSTGIVVNSRQEFYPGAVIKSIDWQEAQEVLSKMPVCRPE
jgi:hypothetical protein